MIGTTREEITELNKIDLIEYLRKTDSNNMKNLNIMRQIRHQKIPSTHLKATIQIPNTHAIQPNPDRYPYYYKPNDFLTARYTTILIIPKATEKPESHKATSAAITQPSPFTGLHNTNNAKANSILALVNEITIFVLFNNLSILFSIFDYAYICQNMEIVNSFRLFL